MLKKSTSRASSSAARTADGTSTMMPTGIASSNGDALLRELVPRLLEQLLDAPDLLDAGDHREEQAHAAVRAGAQDGAQLQP